jgi:hypothetical protein
MKINCFDREMLPVESRRGQKILPVTMALKCISRLLKKAQECSQARTALTFAPVFAACF